MLGRRAILFGCTLVVAIALLTRGASVARAQEVTFEILYGARVITFVQPHNLSIGVEASSDLQTWTPIYSFDLVAEQTEETKTVRSYVSGGDANALFFRLAITEPWQVTLAWEAVDDPEIAGYRVYYRRDGDNFKRDLDVGNTTTALLALPGDYALYYVAVSAYNSAGLESEPSAEIAITQDPWVL